MAAIVLFGLMSAGAAYAQAPPPITFFVNIFFDERCNTLFTNSAGSRFATGCALLQDPGPGGLITEAVNLSNPPGLVGGDVFINEPVTGLSDLLRFDPTVNGGTVFVYSDFEVTDPLPHDLADIGFPTAFNTNQVTLLEVGPENSNGVIYLPLPGQPGYVAGAPQTQVQYIFTSDAPEPATVGLLLAGGVAMLLARRRKAVP